MSHTPLECRVTKTNIAHTRELSDTDLMTSLKTTSVSNYELVENKRGNKADSRKHVGDEGDTRRIGMLELKATRMVSKAH